MLDTRKAYAFDFDSNLVFTQDTIFLLKQNWTSWQETEVNQKEFDQLTVDGKERKWLNGGYEASLKNFLSPGNYKKALIDAIADKKTWPSRSSFLEANETASPLAIITARGQSPQELKESHEYIISHIFSPAQRDHLVQSMQKRLGVEISPEEAIQRYVDNNLYIPVQSKEFFQQSGTTIDIPTRIRKHIGFEMFVLHIESLFRKYDWEKFVNDPWYSVWFSDDNLENIESMVGFIQSDLIPKYPHVEFITYNTNDSENIKKTKVYMGNKG